MPDQTQQPANGNRMVISMDIGTRFSAASFSYQLRGREWSKPEAIKSWPGAPDVTERMGGSVVPSMILYNKNGTAVKFGFEAENALVDEPDKYKTEQYTLVQQFKRQVNRLNSNNVTTNDTGAAVDNGLQGISLKQVYQDWFGYLIRATKERISDQLRAQDFDLLWPQRILVLVIPNGWNIPEKTALSELAWRAECVEDVQDVRFVAESEVALHSILERGSLVSEIQELGSKFMVCDVGAATADVALYVVTQSNPFQVQEVKHHPSISVEAGYEVALDMWRDTRANFPRERDISVPNSHAPSESLLQDNYQGREALQAQMHSIAKAIQDVKGDQEPKLLVVGGGFSNDPENGFLKFLKTSYPEIKIASRQHFEAKSANAAIHCWRETVVGARASSLAYGNAVMVKYNKSSPSHRGRRVVRHLGDAFVEYGWSVVVPLGEILTTNQSHRMHYFRTFNHIDADLSNITVVLYAADATANQEFVFDSDGDFMPGFQEVCTISADLSVLSGKLPRLDDRYFKLEFQIDVELGSTMPCAKILWIGPEGEQRSDPVSFECPESVAVEWECRGN